MIESPTRIVTDATFWIDMCRGGLIDEVLSLGFELIAPDVVVGELIEPDGDDLVKRGLKMVELEGNQVLELFELRSRYPKPGTNDLFALFAASNLGLLLLTGDRHLRRAAEKEGIPVHGTLWFLDKMIDQGIITSQRAADALELMLKYGCRLPRDECDKRIKRWKKK